uniref:Protein ECT2 n=1 Tax=Bursaphelenchus xylophilus TaxID=6326 RepID=A0A1I7S6C2_BURXY
MRWNTLPILEESGEDNLDVDVKPKVCVVGVMPPNGSIVLNVLNKMDCEVVYSDTGADHVNDSNVTFLCWRFDDPIFFALSEADCLILGPTLILQCAGDKKIPTIEKRRPVYTQSLRGMRFSMSGFSGDEVKRCVDLIHFMNGSARGKFTHKDILVAANVTCTKYHDACSVDSTILSMDFLEFCWSKRDDENFQPRDVIDQFRLRCFVGLKIALKGFSNPHEIGKLKAMAKDNGAIIVNQVEATHVLFPDEETAIQHRRPGDKVFYVSPEWFNRSIKIGRRATEYIHPNPMPISPNKTLTANSQFTEQSANTLSAQSFQRRRALNTIADPNNSPMSAATAPSTNVASTSAASFGQVTGSSHSKSSLDNLENSGSGLLDRSADQLDGNGQLPKTKRFKVFTELLDTEQNYVDILSLIITNFKQPLESRPDDLVSRRDLNTLFSRIEPLYHVHSNILGSLKALAGRDFREWRENKLVGQVYATPKDALIDHYVSYMNSYDQAKASLDTILLDPKVASFMKELESNPACRKCSLRDMLIRPVQRLPSVILLLKELRKATDKNNPDYQWLEKAIQSVDEVLTKSNKRRQMTDQYSGFMQIANDIEGFPTTYVQSSREFIQKIDLFVLGAGGMMARLKGKVVSFFLFNDTVVVNYNFPCFRSQADHQEAGNALRRSHSQLRRAVSSVSIHLHRMTSRSKFNDSVSALPR